MKKTFNFAIEEATKKELMQHVRLANFTSVNRRLENDSENL